MFRGNLLDHIHTYKPPSFTLGVLVPAAAVVAGPQRLPSTFVLTGVNGRFTPAVGPLLTGSLCGRGYSYSAMKSSMPGHHATLRTDPFAGLQWREDEFLSLDTTQAKTKPEDLPTTAANTLVMAMADVDISERSPAADRDPSLPPAATLNSLDGDALRVICEKLDGRGLVALAKDTAHEKHIRDASRDEVHRRECSVTTTLAKAEAAGDAAWAAQGAILARRLVGREKPENLTRLISVDEIVRLNELIGVRARSRDKGAVPLSELIDGSLRSSGVGIIGADHRPPPA